MRAARLLPAMLVGTALAMPLRAARGDPPPTSLGDTLPGDAKRDYEDSRTLYEKGDYAGALTKLQSASRTSSDPRLLWDEAVCERAMQHYAGAMLIVRRYLDSHSPLIAPAEVKAARDFLLAAAGHTAHLEVESSESGAIVSVDGEEIGAAPLAADARIDLGAHRISIRKDGFAEYTTTLAVTEGADVHVTARLAPVPPADGRLVVHAGSKDTIAVDGAAVGVASWSGLLPRGVHSVHVTEPDSIPFETEVLVDEHQTRSLDVTLRPTRRGPQVPAWVWIAGSALVGSGAVAAGYLLFRQPETQTVIPVQGSVKTVQLP